MQPNVLCYSLIKVVSTRLYCLGFITLCKVIFPSRIFCISSTYFPVKSLWLFFCCWSYISSVSNYQSLVCLRTTHNLLTLHLLHFLLFFIYVNCINGVHITQFTTHRCLCCEIKDDLSGKTLVQRLSQCSDGYNISTNHCCVSKFEFLKRTLSSSLSWL